MPDIGQPRPPDDTRQCGARNRDGSRCRQWKLAGATRCKQHGGKSPNAVAAAKRRIEEREAEAAMVTYGLPREVDPHTALLEEIHRSAGHVHWLASIVSQLERDALVRGITKTVTLPDGTRRVEAEAAVNTWVQLYQRERDLLRRVCVDAVKAGVEERRVRLEEDLARRMADAMRVTVVELGHDPAAPEVRAAVRRGFTVVDGEVAA